MGITRLHKGGKYTLAALKSIRAARPDDKPIYVILDNLWLWRADHAQPVITPNYSRLIPNIQSDVPGLYLSSMAQIYPEDRGTNYAIRHGRSAARLIADRIRTGAVVAANANPAGAFLA